MWWGGTWLSAPSSHQGGCEGMVTDKQPEIFGWFCHTLYLCTPFAKTGKTVQFERRVGQSVKTPPFHGGMRGSTPLRGTRVSIKTRKVKEPSH